MNFLNIEYLKIGNTKQRSAYQTLVNLQILEKLKAYKPILTGTIPINIDIENSDLDIICFWENKQEFSATLTNLFGEKKEFKIREGKTGEQEIVVCNFKLDDFEMEIFGQNIPSEQQNAYLHMLIEHQILQERGEGFRLKIIELKRSGYKTEPAFAKLLRLDGDPYEALLSYYIQK
ncbi:DUF4269 domain-containing protein [Pedobacter xixiisoli]|uniref:DUF4269 domain-containing protein n=1 Tax=Pedobacter xixiisoli TaxID=1476464 RepID=A0A286AEW4_9SPHI|nr:DUF4269 domain-containing protein [Pedobacter xixiisoli]SOD20430.1 protein of unknown function [Pedobacter xixiisoli]